MLLIFFALTAYAASFVKCDANEIKSFSDLRAEVVKHSDGDTLEVAVGGSVRKVRLLYVDTPETHFQGLSQGESGDRAAKRLAELLPVGSKVLLKFDEVPCDAYGRHLAKIVKNEKEVNLQLVSEGLAANLCFAPNLSGCDEYSQAARQSFKKGPNVFRESSVQWPHEFRIEKGSKLEADWVGSLKTKVVIAGKRFKEIDVFDRVFFAKKDWIQEPYRLENSKR